MNNEIMRLPGVRQAVGLSNTTIWRLERAGAFPRRRQLSASAVGWLRSEILAWIESRAVAGGLYEPRVAK